MSEQFEDESNANGETLLYLVLWILWFWKKCGDLYGSHSTLRETMKILLNGNYPLYSMWNLGMWNLGHGERVWWLTYTKSILQEFNYEAGLR